MSSENNTSEICTCFSTTPDSSTVLQTQSKTLPVTNVNNFFYTFGSYGRFQLVKYGHVAPFEIS